MLSLPTALAALLVSDSFYSIYGLHKYGIHPGAEIWLEGFIGVLIIKLRERIYDYIVENY
ncbi:hypothetical protein DAMA08_031070 [Martiniozyma asiatica (nom. inval.)]|nr:hypothetical protein DAMA08_031070 [Martiniozyma asiatica]